MSKDPPAPQVWHFVQEPGDVPAKGKGRNLTAEETQQWRAWATAKLAAFERGFTKTKDPAVRAFFVHSALSLCGDRPPYFVLKWAADQAKAQLPHDKNAAFLLNYNGLMKSLRAEYEEAKAEAKKRRRAPLPPKPEVRAAERLGLSVDAMQRQASRAKKALGKSGRRGRPKK